MTTLVMFCGGLDSTAMLVKLLEESAHERRVPGCTRVAVGTLAAALPPELLDLTWSCRRPGRVRPCLVCKACKARQGLHAAAAPAHNLGS